MIIYRSCIATSHGPAKYLWSPKKCVFWSLPILITQLAPPTHPHESPGPFPLGCRKGARNRDLPFPKPPGPATQPSTTLIPGFVPTSQVLPATQAVYHRMGTCRAPPPSRPTTTRSPQAWMDMAPQPCPIWAAPRPSSMAQLPTRPMPVSRISCVSAPRTGRHAMGPTVQVSSAWGANPLHCPAWKGPRECYQRQPCLQQEAVSSSLLTFLPLHPKKTWL